MTHYYLTQLATRICGHGKGTCCGCPRKEASPAVANYLKRAKRRYPAAIAYNREYDPHESATSRCHSKRFRWVEHPGAGLRFVGKVHEIRGFGEGNQPYFHRPLIDHTGWFMDSYHDSLAWGVVYQLPASKAGESRYVPGICDTNNDTDGNDGAILDFHSITSDLTDAIRWADSMAERYAEDEREYQIRESARVRIEECAKEIQAEYAGFRTLCQELRANCDAVKGLAEVRKVIRREFQRIKSTIRKLRKEIRKLRDDPYAIDPHY
jgi:hypothetical protein